MCATISKRCTYVISHIAAQHAANYSKILIWNNAMMRKDLCIHMICKFYMAKVVSN